MITCLAHPFITEETMAELNLEAKVEVLYPAQATLGEAPYYEPETDSLLWVDIYKKTINFFDLKTSQNRSLELADSVSSVIPVAGSKDQLIATLERKICLVDRNDGTVLKVLETVLEDKPKNRFNDAKCDSSGRLWCGTMGHETKAGKMPSGEGFLYSYSPGALKEQIPASLSNGLDWNAADDTMYYIDSAKMSIFKFTYNKDTGTISNKEVLIDYSQDPELSLPDGMCMDIAGRLWVASFGLGPGACGQRVTCWDPETRERVMTLHIPGAKRITSCCFGGPNYEWLFVTSAQFGASEEEKATFPNAGAVFVVKDLGTKGRPANQFKAN